MVQNAFAVCNELWWFLKRYCFLMSEAELMKIFAKKNGFKKHLPCSFIILKNLTSGCHTSASPSADWSARKKLKIKKKPQRTEDTCCVVIVRVMITVKVMVIIMVMVTIRVTITVSVAATVTITVSVKVSLSDSASDTDSHSHIHSHRQWQRWRQQVILPGSFKWVTF